LSISARLLRYTGLEQRLNSDKALARSRVETAFAGRVIFEGRMRDAIPSADPARDEWKRRVVEFASSEMFDRLFKEGMALVEQAATYLDGPGRADSRKLNRELALVYAAESMEVTTRLMQAASWLVVQRAVKEKDMGVDEAGDEKYRIARPGEPHPVDRSTMPAPLMSLVDRSRALYERVWRFDLTLYTETPQPADNLVMKQIDRLRAAAERGAFDPLAVWRKE
jgi:regulator of CtrA degradation